MVAKITCKFRGCSNCAKTEELVPCMARRKPANIEGVRKHGTKRPNNEVDEVKPTDNLVSI